MFWKKKEKIENFKPLSSDEYAELYKKISQLLVRVDEMDNRLGLIDSICKSNRARINHLKVDKVIEEEERYKKSDDVVYLGQDGRNRP